MKTKPWAIIVMIICTIFTSTAQLLYKIGAEKLSFDIISIITNWPLILGLILYGLGAVLVVVAFNGGEVTVLYPIITSSYIWVTLGSKYFFGEAIGILKWSGVALIITGILMITFGEKNKKVIEMVEAV